MRGRLRATLVHRDRSFELGGETTFFIGRDPDCDLYIPRDEVSRRHAVVYPVSNAFEIFDFKSSGGVTVNGLPVKRFVLKNNDTIGIGGETIVFRQRSGEESTSEAGHREPEQQHRSTREGLAAFTEQVRDALCAKDRQSCIDALFRAMFSVCGQGVGFYWRVLEDRGFVVETVSEADKEGQGRSATLYQPVLEKLLRMHKVIFSAGTPLAPRSWGDDRCRAPHFAIVPVPATADFKSVFLLQWEADEITIDLEEVSLFLSMFSRFAVVALGNRFENPSSSDR